MALFVSVPIIRKLQLHDLNDGQQTHQPNHSILSEKVCGQSVHSKRCQTFRNAFSASRLFFFLSPAELAELAATSPVLVTSLRLAWWVKPHPASTSTTFVGDSCAKAAAVAFLFFFHGFISKWVPQKFHTFVTHACHWDKCGHANLYINCSWRILWAKSKIQSKVLADLNCSNCHFARHVSKGCLTI